MFSRILERKQNPCAQIKQEHTNVSGLIDRIEKRQDERNQRRLELHQKYNERHKSQQARAEEAASQREEDAWKVNLI